MDEMNNARDESQNIEPQTDGKEKASRSAEQTSSVSQEQNTSHKSHFGKKALIFGLIALSAIALYCVVNINSISQFINLVGDIILPLIIGVVIAYLCNPIFEFYEYKVFNRLRNGDVRRGLSLFLTVLTAIAIISLLLLMVLPQIVDSITDLVSNYQTYIDNLLGGIKDFINSMSAQL